MTYIGRDKMKIVILTNEKVMVLPVPKEYQEDIEELEEWLFGEEGLDLIQSETEWRTYKDLVMEVKL